MRPTPMPAPSDSGTIEMWLLTSMRTSVSTGYTVTRTNLSVLAEMALRVRLTKA
ncbi:hypothetical protein SAMN06295937_10774 [Sphingopyxis flava]|uniref:Uncharacterized protein n=1 Tax=Sphingopyxis flava TaxID=1507287 RepID=A0A1T5GHM0_9SPHN|nr:hypothetical protein SAMN06295937_10774 [Sphingopyxis flava]